MALSSLGCVDINLKLSVPVGAGSPRQLTNCGQGTSNHTGLIGNRGLGNPPLRTVMRLRTVLDCPVVMKRQQYLDFI